MGTTNTWVNQLCHRTGVHDYDTTTTQQGVWKAASASTGTVPESEHMLRSPPPPSHTHPGVPLRPRQGAAVGLHAREDGGLHALLRVLLERERA